MNESTIQVEKAGDVHIIRLNNPAKLNAIGIPMTEALDRAIDAGVREARVIMLAGAGRAFSSGASLDGGVEGGVGAGSDLGAMLETHINPLMSKLRSLPIPWISAVRGAVAGVGCSLALAADMVIASETAFFLQAFVRIGFIPDGGSSYLLARNISRVRATEMMMLGDKLPAAQALEWGLINRVVPDDQLEAAALDLAMKLATGPTLAYGLIRKLAWDAQDGDWESILQAERVSQREVGWTPDACEGVASFNEKRPARFTGRPVSQ